MVTKNLVDIGSGNGLSPDRPQAITWTNDDLLPIRPWKIYFNGILVETLKFSFDKIHLKMADISVQASTAS